MCELSFIEIHEVLTFVYIYFVVACIRCVCQLSNISAELCLFGSCLSKSDFGSCPNLSAGIEKNNGKYYFEELNPILGVKIVATFS